MSPHEKDPSNRQAREPLTDEEVANRPFTRQLRQKLPESEEELRRDE